MTNAEVQYDFWASFKLDAYDETSVPDEKTRIALNGKAFPYLTYETADDSFENEVPASASLWYRSTSWADITAKAKEIKSAIGRGGIILRTDGGALWLKRGTPFAQRMSDTDDSIRRMVLNVTVEFIEQ